MPDSRDYDPQNNPQIPIDAFDKPNGKDKTPIVISSTTPHAPQNWKGTFLPISAIADLYQVKRDSIKKPLGEIHKNYFYLEGKAFRRTGSCGYCMMRTGSKPTYEYNPEYPVIKKIIDRVKNNSRPAKRRKS